MNERLRELVKQSGGEFWQRLENDVVKQDAYITFDPPKSLEKFVELIVCECANVILKWKVEPFPLDPEFGAKIIKEHFGVEE